MHGLAGKDICSLKAKLFWDFTVHRLVVCYRRFGNTYLNQLQGLTLEDGTDIQWLTLEDGTDIQGLTLEEETYRLSRKVGKKSTNLRCVNIPEERRSHLHSGGSLKSRKSVP